MNLYVKTVVLGYTAAAIMPPDRQSNVTSAAQRIRLISPARSRPQAVPMYIRTDIADCQIADITDIADWRDEIDNTPNHGLRPQAYSIHLSIAHCLILDPLAIL